MPAAFVRTGSGDIFKSGGGSDHLVSVPYVDEIIGAGGLAVYDTVSVQLGETIQYFLTFDDVIKFIHFGKGVGAVTAEGTMYSTCDGSLPGAAGFAQAVSALRGKATYLTVGNVVVAATLTNAQLSISSQPDTMAHFIFNFAVVNHQL